MARLRPEQGPKRLRRLAQERGMRSFVQEGQRDLSADFDVPSGRGFIALLEAFRATGGTAPVRSWASCWKSIRPAKPPASPSSVTQVRHSSSSGMAAYGHRRSSSMRTTWL